MMIILAFFLPYYLLYISTIIILFFIGNFYILFFLQNLSISIRGDFTKTVSYSLTTGFIIVVSTIAVYYTKFNTIFLWPFVFVLYPIFKFSLRTNLNFINIRTNFTKTNIILVFTIASLIYAYNAYIFYKPDHSVHFDFIFYGKMANSLIKYKIESPLVLLGNFYDTKINGLYHFGDLWIAGFIGKFNVSSVYTIIFTIYPLLHLMLFLLVISFIISENIFLNLLLTISILYGHKLFFYEDSFKWAIGSLTPFRGFPGAMFPNKLLCVYTLTLYGYSLYKNNFKTLSSIIFAFVHIFYTVVTPVFAGIALSFFFISVMAKKINLQYWDWHYKNSIPLLLVILFIYTYININPNFEIIKMPIHFYGLKTYCILLIETLFKCIAESFLILILLFYLLFKYGLKHLMRPFILMFFLGFLGGFLYVYTHNREHPDTYQVLWNATPILLLILSFEIIQLIKKNNILKLITPIIFLFSAWNLVNFSFNKGTYGTQKLNVPLTESFKSNILNYSNTLSRNLSTCSVSQKFGFGDWLYNLDNKFQDLFYSDKIDIPLEIGFLLSNDEVSNKFNHPYFKHYTDSVVTEQRIIQFMKSKGANHLFVDNEVKIPASFLSNFELLFEDKKNNLSFWRLKV